MQRNYLTAWPKVGIVSAMSHQHPTPTYRFTPKALTDVTLVDRDHDDMPYLDIEGHEPENRYYLQGLEALLDAGLVELVPPAFKVGDRVHVKGRASNTYIVLGAPREGDGRIPTARADGGFIYPLCIPPTDLVHADDADDADGNA